MAAMTYFQGSKCCAAT